MTTKPGNLYLVLVAALSLAGCRPAPQQEPPRQAAQTPAATQPTPAEPSSPPLATPAPPAAPPTPASPALSLRATPRAVAHKEIVDMVRAKGFSHPADYTSARLSGVVKGTLKHKLVTREVGGKKSITDDTTGLMWLNAGGDDLLKGDKVRERIALANREAWAGASGWRLPTIEELASLITNDKLGPSGHIDPAFGAPLWFVLSADRVAGQEGDAWAVEFSGGMILDHTVNDDYSILLVRKKG